MPGWSPEIANEFIKLGAAEYRLFDQLRLQGLVYIAHGWCLAFYDQPLTGDRPEAWESGPMYPRLVQALIRYGRQPVTGEILHSDMADGDKSTNNEPVQSDLEQFEHALINEIYQKYGALESWQLSAVTVKGDTPWREVFAAGAGKFCDIPHHLIRGQFVDFLRQSPELPDGI